MKTTRLCAYFPAHHACRLQFLQRSENVVLTTQTILTTQIILTAMTMVTTATVSETQSHSRVRRFVPIRHVYRMKLVPGDECLDICNGLSPDTQRSFRYCLQREADEDEAIDEYCDARLACLPTLGACYWQCNDSGQCRDSSTMTETDASQAELDYGGSPNNSLTP